MPKVGLLIFLFWTPHFVVWTSHFGWTPRLNYTVLLIILGTVQKYDLLLTDSQNVHHSANAKLIHKRGKWSARAYEDYETTLISDSSALVQTPAEATTNTWPVLHGVPVYSSPTFTGTKLYCPVERWLQLRFDFDSDCNATRYDHSTTYLRP